VADDFHTLVRPQIEALLEPGEALAGICAATQQSTFKGSLVALAVTDRRLILQKLGRKVRPSEDPVSIGPGEIASASAEGAGVGWANVTASVMEGSAVTLKMRTTDGEKRKLMMMRGGDGLLGRLGGGEQQQAGVEALASWFAAIPSS
jgi:hypothetical protein